VEKNGFAGAGGFDRGEQGPLAGGFDRGEQGPLSFNYDL